MVTADQVVVELEARIQQYMANVGQAEAKFVGATNKIAAGAQTIQNVTEKAFAGSLSSVGKYSTGAQTSLNALQTGFTKFTASFADIQNKGGKFLSPLDVALTKTATNQRKMAANVLSANVSMEKSFANLNSHTATSIGALNAGVDSFTTKIRDIPDMVGRMQNPFVPFNQWFDNVNKNAYNLQFNLGNLTAQINDIGVTAFGGMDPLLIALQQGTQLSQAFAGQNLEQVVKGIGAAFDTLRSPTTLVTIGLIAGAAALIQWGMAALTTEEGASGLEEAQKKLDKTTGDLNKTLQDLANTSDRETFGDMTDEVKALTTALAELDRVAELKALKDTLKNAVSDKLTPGFFEGIGTSIGEVGKAFTSNEMGMGPKKTIQQVKFDELTGGKGMSFADFDAQTKLLETKALAGDVQGVLAGIQELLQGLANGGPITSINSELADTVATMGRAAIQVAETEAKYNGSAEAAKKAADEAKEWLKIDEQIAAVAQKMADNAKERVAETDKERTAAAQNLELATAEMQFGKDSVEALTVKREIEKENLETRLRASGLYEEDVQKISDMVEKTEQLNTLTGVWATIVDGVAAAKEKLLEKSAKIAEKTSEETIAAQQALELAQAAAQYGADSAQYAEVKNQIDRDNLETQLRAADVSQTQIDNIIAIVTETDNVIAATNAWESAMAGVASQIAGIVSALASIGGGMIANASKSVELKALKEGKTRAEAATEAKRFNQDLELRAGEAGVTNPFIKLLNAGKRYVVERGQVLDDELALEREAAGERERIANKAARGSGGKSKGRKGKEDPRQSVYEQIAALEKEAGMLDGLALGYSKYGSAVEIARKEEQILQALQKQGIELTPKVREEALLLAQSYVVAADAAKEAQERHSEFESKLNDFKSTAESAFTGLISGAMSFREALVMVIAKLAEMATSNAFESLWNVGGKSASSGLLGLLFGGARAGFGPVTKGNSYIVGERGKEWFTPDSSGTISAAPPSMGNAPMGQSSAGGSNETLVRVWVDDDGKLKGIAEREGYKGGAMMAAKVKKEVPSTMMDYNKRHA